MDWDQLRSDILRTIYEIEKTTGHLAEDSDIGQRLNVPITDIQDQLGLLEDSRLVELLEDSTGASAHLTPTGKQYVRETLGVR